jgi:hypothetical protein
LIQIKEDEETQHSDLSLEGSKSSKHTNISLTEAAMPSPSKNRLSVTILDMDAITGQSKDSVGSELQLQIDAPQRLSLQQPRLGKYLIPPLGSASIPEYTKDEEIQVGIVDYMVLLGESY